MLTCESDGAPRELSEHLRLLLARTRAAEMHDRGDGRVVHLPASVAEPVAEVDLFLIHEVLLVETSNRVECLPPDCECGADDPVDGRAALFGAAAGDEPPEATFLREQ